jgi:diaminopimelate decarboxylase
VEGTDVIDRAEPPRAWLPDQHLSPALRALLERRCASQQLGLVADLTELDRRCALARQAALVHDVGLLCAVKASTNPEVLRRVARHGIGFDVANARELAHAQAADPLASVSLTSPALPIAERAGLYAAFRDGRIQRWHCDSLLQLEDLVRACPGSAVGVRINMDGAPWPEGIPMYRPSRFGLRLDQLPLARDLARAHGCTLSWLHIHNGSEENTIESYTIAAEIILEAARRHDLSITSLDLGGGILQDTVDELFSAVRRLVGPDFEVMFEPGRFWLNDCMALVTQVLDIKETRDQVLLVLDIGTLSHTQWSDRIRIPSVGRLRPDDPRVWRICGRTCFEEDMFDEWEAVPLDESRPVPRVGECVVLGNITGYSIELRCDFNGVTPPTAEFLEP